MVRDFGGVEEDYNELNLFIDSSKLHYPFWLHRVVTHNSFFVGICEKVIGMYITNSDNKRIPTRVLAEEHIKQDLNGKIPSIQDWLEAIKDKKQEDWMNTPRKSDLQYLKKLK